MTTSAKAKVAAARTALDTALADLQEERRRRRILCSCGKLHTIGKLKVLITHYYHEPHGCTGGDYWSEGEWQFICPSTSYRNRLLFDDYALDWRQHGSTELAFKELYRGLFASSVEVHGDDEEVKHGRVHRNNYYVDEHRERFELPAKPKR